MVKMGLKERAILGVKWNMIATIICMFIQIIRLAILTRLLDKSDFGLIAIAMMVIAFTDIFSDLGITVALIHKQDISDKQYSSVYWLNIVVSILMTVIVCVCSPFVASFYNEPILRPVVSLLSLQILFNGFGKMFQTIKQKNLEFNFISKIRILTTIIGFIITIVLAYLKYGVYSLVIGQLVQIGVNQLIFAIAGLKHQKIHMYFSFKEIKDILKIGVYQLGSKILDFISAKLDVLLIGRFFSMGELGIYNIAKDLIVKPFLIVNGVSANVFSSAFAQIQNNIIGIKLNYKKVVSIVTMICVPIYVVIFLFADLIVSILYDPEFVEVSIFLRILAFVGIESAISSQGGILQVAFGRTDIGFRWTICRIILYTVVLLITSMYNIYVLAYGQLGLSIISLVLYYYLVIKPIIRKITIKEYFQMFYKIIIGTFILAIPFRLLLYFVEMNIFLQIVLVCIFGLCYILYIRKSNFDLYNEILIQIFKIKK